MSQHIIRRIKLLLTRMNFSAPSRILVEPIAKLATVKLSSISESSARFGPCSVSLSAGEPTHMPELVCETSTIRSWDGTGRCAGLRARPAVAVGPRNVAHCLLPPWPGCT